jgi:predicted RNA-binding protein YlxR (DUF448 family)/ribosomal protein L7Ae-like RNA K-turn-binding protein
MRVTAETRDESIAGSERELDPETGPLRRCVLTRDRLPKEQMIRFVLGPGGVLAPDLVGRLPGRGIWLSARGNVLETARAQGTLVRAFARAARGPVSVPADFACVLQTGLTRRICEFLGLARRAGQAVAGFEKAQGWLRSGRVGLVLQACDGSPEERARFLSRAGVDGRGLGDSIAVLAPLSATELGTVFGRDHVVHVVVIRGRLAEVLVNESRRLSGIAGRQR